MDENDLINLKHTVDTVEKAINEDAVDIRKIKEQLALVTEALSKIEITAYRSHTQVTHEQALTRLKEIVTKLSESYPPR